MGVNHMKKTLAILLCAVLLLACSCGGSGQTESENPSSEAVVSDESKAETFTGTYFDTDIWQAVPMISQALIDAGYEGGEGCQATTFLVRDSIDGQLCFLGTDVGGLYRSTDGGDHWVISTMGLDSAGATGFAIDPTNKNRVICCGSNSGGHNVNGLYLSTDAGETWKSVQRASVCCYRDYRTQVAFDPTSYDEALGGCKVIYWSRERKSTNGESLPILYKSEDGGETWTKLAGTENYGGANIYVNKDTGALICGNEYGVNISTDGGKTFKKVLDEKLTFMDCLYNKPGHIYAISLNGIHISTDMGATWKTIKGSKFPTVNPTHLRVSPADQNYMLIQDAQYQVNGTWNMNGYVSHDGGQNWRKIERSTAGSWVPSNSGDMQFCWSLKDKNNVLTTWSYVMKSTDGGQNFKWNNAGYNGICVGGKMNWNVNHPELMLITSQDYNGGYTNDNGKTWNYLSWAGAGWGGWTYGGYALDSQHMFAGVASKMFGSTVLWTTHDGGKTFNNTNLAVSGYNVGMGVKGNDDIGFFGEYRTTDKGYTWTKMEGCTGVISIDYESGMLLGANQYNVVISNDNGETWEKICAVGDEVSDLCYNPKSKKLFVATGALSYIDMTAEKKTLKPVNTGASSVKGCCVDPSNPDIMYIGCTSNSNYNIKAVLRSLDGGETWTCLTRQVGDGRTGPDGGRQASTIRVNANTHEVFTMTGCKGMWKMSGPPSSYYE
jgi:photosystem II stability/assembly factor-like uncharacterized protein